MLCALARSVITSAAAICPRSCCVQIETILLGALQLLIITNYIPRPNCNCKGMKRKTSMCVASIGYCLCATLRLHLAFSTTSSQTTSIQGSHINLPSLWLIRQRTYEVAARPGRLSTPRPPLCMNERRTANDALVMIPRTRKVRTLARRDAIESGGGGQGVQGVGYLDRREPPSRTPPVYVTRPGTPAVSLVPTSFPRL